MFAYKMHSSDSHHYLQYVDTLDPHALYTNHPWECLLTMQLLISFQKLKNNDVVISLSACCMKIILDSDSNHSKGLLRVIKIFQFLMEAAAKPLNVLRGIKNIKRLQQVFKALEGLIL